MRAARTTGREEPEAVVATVAARRAAGTTLYMHSTLKHMHRARFHRDMLSPSPPPTPPPPPPNQTWN